MCPWLWWLWYMAVTWAFVVGAWMERWIFRFLYTIYRFHVWHKLCLYPSLPVSALSQSMAPGPMLGYLPATLPPTLALLRFCFSCFSHLGSVDIVGQQA